MSFASSLLNWCAPYCASPNRSWGSNVTRYSICQLLFRMCPGSHGRQVNEMTDLSLEVRWTFHSHGPKQLAQEFSHLSVSSLDFSVTVSSQAVTCVRRWRGLTRADMLHARRPIFSVFSWSTSCCLLLGH